jgi:hypothetical protein
MHSRLLLRRLSSALVSSRPATLPAPIIEEEPGIDKIRGMRINSDAAISSMGPVEGSNEYEHILEKPPGPPPPPPTLQLSTTKSTAAITTNRSASGASTLTRPSSTARGRLASCSACSPSPPACTASQPSTTRRRRSSSYARRCPHRSRRRVPARCSLLEASIDLFLESTPSMTRPPLPPISPVSSVKLSWSTLDEAITDYRV